MIIAVFGDVHGALDRMYLLCKQWETRTGNTIDHVLQIGDIGAFPDKNNVDRATRRHAERDPTELGTSDYLQGLKRASHHTIFIAGNHEDFDFLKEHENQTVDPAGQMFYLATGRPIELASGDEVVRVVGFGGTHPITTKRKKLEAGLGRKYHGPDEAAKLLALTATHFDILLTHDGPAGKELESTHGPAAGSPEVAKVIAALQPRFAFFGHYGNPPAPFTVGKTMVIPMNNSAALSVRHRDGAMGILDTETWHFEFVKP